MAISPPSDIVSDVARAADPARYQAASQRLSEGAAPVDGTGFDAAARQVGALRGIGGADVYTLRNSLKSDAGSAEADKAKAAYQQFEAFVLQTFIESMLPKDAENTFGKGNAGAIWKSMMAEQLGTQIAKSGGIGIASKVLAGRNAAENIRPESAQPAPAFAAKLRQGEI
ncbi:rod-binding protein [Microvirga roseola]|uniref:rod-binding protein n=1 Tax=Microvirga roseola TaxID=2883126 RepID=UPI001E5151A1|nr:rod-binding protein [Microvirga roseola]